MQIEGRKHKPAVRCGSVATRVLLLTVSPSVWPVHCTPVADHRRANEVAPGPNAYQSYILRNKTVRTDGRNVRCRPVLSGIMQCS